MKELLSADELSDLLTAVSEGPAPAPAQPAARGRSVQPLDFRQSCRLSAEQLRAVQQFHASATIGLSSIVAGYLQAPADVDLVSVGAVAYGTFSSAVPTPACIQVFRVSEGGHRGLLVLDMPMAFGLIERMLGGRGQALDQPRPLTEIEQAILADPLRSILAGLAEAWAPVAKVAFEPESIRMTPRAAQIAAAKDVVIQTTFTIGSEASVGDLGLCLPLAFVEQLLPRDKAQLAALLGQRDAEPDALDAIRRSIGTAPVRIAAELGRTHISVLDLLKLRPGHVVRLDTAIGDTLDVTIEREPRLAGRPGLLGKKLGLEITGFDPTTRKGTPRP